MACRHDSGADEAADRLAPSEPPPAYTTDELQELLDADVDIPEIPATYLCDTE